jgi:hypothetical protein
MNAGPTAVVRLPCLRRKISEVKFITKFEHPQMIWTQRWKTMEIREIDDWASPEVKTIYITQDVGGPARLWFPLVVRRFVPQPGDALSRNWSTNGVPRNHPCAQYAVASMGDTVPLLMEYVRGQVATAINFYVPRDDDLLHSTYKVAYWYAQTADVSGP